MFQYETSCYTVDGAEAVTLSAEHIYIYIL